jgi:hypothetical protein
MNTIEAKRTSTNPVVAKILNKPEKDILPYNSHEYKLCKYSLRDKAKEWLETDEAKKLMDEHEVTPDEISRLQHQITFEIYENFWNELLGWAEGLEPSDIESVEQINLQLEEEANLIYGTQLMSHEILGLGFNDIPILSEMVKSRLTQLLEECQYDNQPFYYEVSCSCSKKVKEKYDKLVEGEEAVA